MTSRTVSRVGSMSVSGVRARIACSTSSSRRSVSGSGVVRPLGRFGRGVAHPATGLVIQMLSGSPPEPGSRSTSTKPLCA